MDQLRGIGYWKRHFIPSCRTLSTSLTRRGMSGQGRHADYLGRGILAHVFMGWSTCRICGKDDNGDLEYTDGTYLWPSGLAHYVKDHGVRLPDEFVRHAQEVVIRNEEAPVDWTWWSRQEPLA